VDVEEAIADVGLFRQERAEFELIEPLLDFSGRAGDLGSRRGVVGIVGDQACEFEGVVDVALEREPGLDLAFDLFEPAQMGLRVFAVVPEVGLSGGLFELFEFAGAGFEVKDTAGRGRPSGGSPRAVR
jgi:hypothetical protein